MSDNELLAKFLIENYELFQSFLSKYDIEETEAEVIIDNLNFG